MTFFAAPCVITSYSIHYTKLYDGGYVRGVGNLAVHDDTARARFHPKGPDRGGVQLNEARSRFDRRPIGVEPLCPERAGASYNFV